MKIFSLPILSFFIFSFTAFPQWTQIGTLSGIGPNPRICVADSNIVWVAGGTETFPKIYRTVDGGVNWVSIPTTGLPIFLMAIAAKDSVTAFVADIGDYLNNGGNAKLYKTTDAGLNWTVIDSTGGTAGFYNDIQFSKSNPQFGIAMSDPAEGFGRPYIVNKTTDGGVTWEKTNPPGVPNSYGLFYTAYAIDPQFYGFANWNSTTNMMTSYTTNDGGNNWFLGDSGVPVVNWGDIVFNDDKQHGVMFGNEWPNIKVTSNGGINWVTVNTGTDISGTSAASWVSNTDIVFICAWISPSNKKVIRSDDNGLTWQQQDTPPVAIREVDNIRYGDVIYGYAVTSNAIVLKSINSVTEVESEVTPINNYHLIQNFPNPFNPFTSIQYSIPQRSNAVLRVYDILGNELVTLVNEEKDRGVYTITFDGSGLASGMYLYRLQAGSFVATKKMVLMK